MGVYVQKKGICQEPDSCKRRRHRNRGNAKDRKGILKKAKVKANTTSSELVT